jgi:diaminohydroxyphosphoribosylaminopyrimidine deaminase/5-amino-6-(5-phosphoribosylamino)uracil reductase
VRTDDPELTTRTPGGRDATRVLLDTTLSVEARARVLGRGALVFCADDAPRRELPAEVVRVPRGAGGLDVEAVLRALAARGLHRVLVEGGGRLHRSFLDAGVVDRVELFVAGRALGAGLGLFAGPGLGLAAAPTFRVVSATTVGDDAHVVFER